MSTEFDDIPVDVEVAKSTVLETEFGRKIFAPASWWSGDDAESDAAISIEEARTSDMNLMVRAMNERWPITPEKRAQMIEAAEEVMKLSKSPRTKLAAMKVLLMADALNVRTDDGGKHLHLHNDAPIVDTKEVARKLMMDPKYISFLRQLDSTPTVGKDSLDVDFSEAQAEAELNGDSSVHEGVAGERGNEGDSLQKREEGEQGAS